VTDRLLLAPGRIVGLRPSGRSAAVVLLVTEGKYGVGTGKQAGGRHLLAVARVPGAAVEPWDARVAGDVARCTMTGSPAAEDRAPVSGSSKARKRASTTTVTAETALRAMGRAM
jgi:hypothetical protein